MKRQDFALVALLPVAAELYKRHAKIVRQRVPALIITQSLAAKPPYTAFHPFYYIPRCLLFPAPSAHSLYRLGLV